MTRKTWQIIGVVLLVGLLFVAEAHAAIDSNGVLDNVLNQYWQAASQWSSILTSAARRLFWSLVVISMVWTFGMMLLRKADIGEFFAEFVRFTIFTGFFWWLLTNGPVFANSIIQSLTQLGSTASGLGNSFLPSSIVDVGFGIFGKVIDGSKILEPIDSAIGIIIALIILFILALIGINMLLLMVAAWILAYAGIFFLGFGGSQVDFRYGGQLLQDRSWTGCANNDGDPLGGNRQDLYRQLLHQHGRRHNAERYGGHAHRLPGSCSNWSTRFPISSAVSPTVRVSTGLESAAMVQRRGSA